MGETRQCMVKPKKNYSKAHKERDPKERDKKKHEKVQLQSLLP